MNDMTQFMNSMADTMKLQIHANAERRAQKAEHEKKEFLKKLQQAAASQMEIEGTASKVKGADDAAQRDQLMGMML